MHGIKVEILTFSRTIAAECSVDPQGVGGKQIPRGMQPIDALRAAACTLLAVEVAVA